MITDSLTSLKSISRTGKIRLYTRLFEKIKAVQSLLPGKLERIDKNKFKFSIIAALLLLSFFSIFYFHFVLKREAVFTQFFYIPIILASLWWRRKGIIIALMLALTLLLSNHFLKAGAAGTDDYFRALFFVIVSTVLALLSEKDSRLQTKINENYEILNEKKEQLEGEIEERIHAERMARALLNVTTESIFMLSTDGTILEINEIAAQRLGRARYELIGTCLYDHLPEEVAGARKQKIEEIRETGRCVRFQADRDNIIFDINMYPVLDKYKGVESIALFARDITPLLKLQKEIITISESERHMLGQNLHDDLGQYLTGIKYMTTSLAQKMSGKEYPEAGEMFEISSYIGNAIDRIRRLARSLYPVTLESNGFLSAIEDLCFEIEKIFTISCKTRVRGSIGNIDSAKSVHLFYIAQESVNNALKHANAKNILINLTRKKDRLKMSIENDHGYVEKSLKNKKKGIGLDIMKYRANLMNAELEIRTTPQKYIVSIEVNI